VAVLPDLPAPHLRRPPRAEVEELRRRLQLPARYFLFLGARSRRKNLRLLAEAWSRAALGEVGLVLAGPGEEGVPGARDLGYVPAVQLPALISGALAWVNPSLYEGSALGALEAMACGTPVVAAATGAQAHAVGLDGILLPADDVDEWARGLKAVAADPGLRGRLSAAGLRKLRELRASPLELLPLLSALGEAPRGARPAAGRER
jgi:glycosyltransferase involved in cell wall biosynthesis